MFFSGFAIINDPASWGTPLWKQNLHQLPRFGVSENGCDKTPQNDRVLRKILGKCCRKPCNAMQLLGRQPSMVVTSKDMKLERIEQSRVVGQSCMALGEVEI